MMMRLCVLMVALLGLGTTVFADTPGNCTYPEVAGQWIFQIGGKGYTNTINCSDFGTSTNPPKTKLMVNLYFPDVAVDEFGNKGFWTLIYNQGFEVVVAGRKYFAFSLYKSDGQSVVSMCDKTMAGWSHNELASDWACYSGAKTQTLPMKIDKRPLISKHNLKASVYRANSSFIESINSKQTSWKAGIYAQFEGMKMEDIVKMAGGRRSLVHSIPKPSPITDKQARQVTDLPKSFDWRNVNGVSYVSPIRNQGGCGSCYAFSSMGMNEARWRVMTNNTQQPVFSPQDIVECSEYSQGCEGGFPYLIGGKYAEDFGLVLEECNPYTGKDGTCSTVSSCPRTHSTKYEYVGGFYGACNEALMKIELVKNGPMSVSFEVYDDFMHYTSGVYHHTGLKRPLLNDGFNPFEITNHAVLLVGYGTDTTQGTAQDYWIVKNSWGPEWGEEGYFRIRRGADECSIESIAVQSFPVM